MTTAILRPLPRTLLASALALAGTIASFGATTTPVYAAAARYTATLVTPIEAPRRAAIGAALWSCDGDQCTAASDGSNPVTACQRLVKKIGPVTNFASPRGELSAEDLQRCNAAA